MKIFLILSFFALHTCVDAAGSSHSIPMHAQESEAIENKALCFFESPNNDVHQVFYTRAHNNPLKFTLFMTFDVSSKDKRKWRQSLTLKKKPSKDESTVVLGDRNLLFSLTSMTYGGDHFIFYNKKSAILQCETMADVDVIQFKKS
ncbi:MAG: hypothetical protein K2X98_02395, partial [Alphaproteobacteria bacterium]|nr:hypothetical protein [Alphaproteobacteria bacterium]